MVNEFHVEVDTLAPCRVEVADFPCLEVGRVLAPCLSAEGATVSHSVLVGLRLGFPSGRCGLAESRKSGGD